MLLSFLSKESNQRKIAAWFRTLYVSALAVVVLPVRYAMLHILGVVEAVHVDDLLYINNFDLSLMNRYRIERAERPDKKPGQKVKAGAGKDFFVLIFCFFSIKRKEVALRGNERANVHSEHNH